MSRRTILLPSLVLTLTLALTHLLPTAASSVDYNSTACALYLVDWAKFSYTNQLAYAQASSLKPGDFGSSYDCQVAGTTTSGGPSNSHYCLVHTMLDVHVNQTIGTFPSVINLDQLIGAGLCLPSVCSSQDVQVHLNEWLGGSLFLPVDLLAHFATNSSTMAPQVVCEEEQVVWYQFDPMTMGLFVFMLAMVVISLISTLVHLMYLNVTHPISTRYFKLINHHPPRSKHDAANGIDDDLNRTNLQDMTIALLPSRVNVEQKEEEVYIHGDRANSGATSSSPLASTSPSSTYLLRDQNGGPQNHAHSESINAAAIQSSKPPPLPFMIDCFSLILNYRKLHAPIPPDVNGFNLSVLNGIRVLSICWILIGHSFGTFRGMSSNTVYFTQLQGEWWASFILGGEFAVDTFFFLSAFLLTYLGYGPLKKVTNKWKGFSLSIINRYLRLTPIYLFWLLIWWKFMPAFNFTFFNKFFIESYTDSTCGPYWWTNILYINNFYPTNSDNSCMGWGWYLGNDFWFGTLITGIILSAILHPTLGWCCIHICTLGTIIVSMVLVVTKDMTAPDGGNLTYYYHFYNRPYCRFPASAIGVYLGMICLKQSNWMNSLNTTSSCRRFCQISNPWFRWLLYLICGFFMIFLIMIVWPLNRTVDPVTWSQTSTVLYLSLSRPIWCACVAMLTWIWFQTNQSIQHATVVEEQVNHRIKGDSRTESASIAQPLYGSLISRILSSRYWLSLSRLTYQVYLIHDMLFIGFQASLENFIVFTYFNIIIFIVLGIISSFSLAFLGFLFIEKPIMNIQTKLLKGSG